MQSQTGYFLSKYGWVHKLGLVLWLNAPFLLFTWFTYEYSEILFYPYWFLNVQTAWLMYCCFEKGLTLLVDKVMWAEYYWILSVPWIFGFCCPTDHEIENNAEIKDLHQRIWSLLNSEDARNRMPTPIDVGFSYNKTRVYVRILMGVIQEPENNYTAMMKKYRRLALLYALRMSFFPMLMMRLYCWAIVFVLCVGCVFVCEGLSFCISKVYGWHYTNEYEKLLRKKMEEEAAWSF